jgi:hypothetical protein
VVFQRFARTTAVALFAVLKADLHDFIVGTYICASSIVFIRVITTEAKETSVCRVIFPWPLAAWALCPACVVFGWDLWKSE